MARKALLRQGFAGILISTITNIATINTTTIATTTSTITTTTATTNTTTTATTTTTTTTAAQLEYVSLVSQILSDMFSPYVSGSGDEVESLRFRHRQRERSRY